MKVTKHTDGKITIQERKGSMVVEKTFNCSERRAKDKFKEHVRIYFN